MIVSCRYKSVLRRQHVVRSVRWLVGTTMLMGALTTVAAANLSASLSTDEQQFAGSVAASQTWAQKNSKSQTSSQRIAQPSAQRNNAGPQSSRQTGAHLLDVQTLSIELDEAKKNNSQRRAKVYQFNYNTQQSRLVLIDLGSRNVVKTQPIDSIHLPLNDHEIATARTLIEQQPALMDALNREQQNRGLTALVDLSGIDVKASIFEPNNAEHLCKKQRCALLSLFDHTRTVFSTEPLVNLQTLNVTTLQESF